MKVITIQCILYVLVFFGTGFSNSVIIKRQLADPVFPDNASYTEANINYDYIDLFGLDTICISSCYFLFYPAADSGNTVICYSFICGDSLLFPSNGLAAVIKIETIIDNPMHYFERIDSVLSSSEPPQITADAYTYNGSGTSWMKLSREFEALSSLVMQNDRGIIDQIEQCIGSDIKTIGRESFNRLRQDFLDLDCESCIESVHSDFESAAWYAFKCVLIAADEEE